MKTQLRKHTLTQRTYKRQALNND